MGSHWIIQPSAGGDGVRVLCVWEGRECARKPALRVCAEKARRLVLANMRQRSASDSVRLTICAYFFRLSFCLSASFSLRFIANAMAMAKAMSKRQGHGQWKTPWPRITAKTMTKAMTQKQRPTPHSIHKYH